MTHQVIRGFVLREQNVGESDKLLEILTADQGLITVSARGSRRPKSRLLAAAQIFSLADYQVFRYKGRVSVDSAELIEGFFHLREDIHRLVCAAHLAEVFLDLLRDNLPDRTAYELWAFSANKLQSGADPLLAVHVAQLRLLALEGFAPSIQRCHTCHEPIQSSAVFSFEIPGILCNKTSCQRSLSGAHVRMSTGTLACVGHVLSSHVSRLFQFQLADSIRQEFVTFSDSYLCNQMEKNYTRLALLNDLEPE